MKLTIAETELIANTFSHVHNLLYNYDHKLMPNDVDKLLCSTRVDDAFTLMRVTLVSSHGFPVGSDFWRMILDHCDRYRSQFSVYDTHTSLYYAKRLILDLEESFD